MQVLNPILIDCQCCSNQNQYALYDLTSVFCLDCECSLHTNEDPKEDNQYFTQVEILLATEDEFKIEFSDSDMDAIVTLKDLVAYLDDKFQRLSAKDIIHRLKMMLHNIGFDIYSIGDIQSPLNHIKRAL